MKLRNLLRQVHRGECLLGEIIVLDDRYYGITGNIHGLSSFAHEAQRIWRKWLDRQSQRAGMRWEKFIRLSGYGGVVDLVFLIGQRDAIRRRTKGACSSYARALGEPSAGKAETRDADQKQQESDQGGEDACPTVAPDDGLEQELPVLLQGFDGDDWTQATPLPGRDGGTWDGDMPRKGSGAGADHVLA